jgi:hypothetical protein
LHSHSLPFLISCHVFPSFLMCSISQSQSLMSVLMLWEGNASSRRVPLGGGRGYYGGWEGPT